MVGIPAPHIIKADSPPKSTHISTLSVSLLQLQWIQLVSFRLSRSHWRNLCCRRHQACGASTISDLLTVLFPPRHSSLPVAQGLGQWFRNCAPNIQKASDSFRTEDQNLTFAYSVSCIYIDQFQGIWGSHRAINCDWFYPKHFSNSTHLIHAAKQ